MMESLSCLHKKHGRPQRALTIQSRHFVKFVHQQKYQEDNERRPGDSRRDNCHD